MIIESDTESDINFVGELVKLMYDNSSPKYQSPPSPHNFSSENLGMEEEGGTNLTVNLNMPCHDHDQLKTNEAVGLDKLLAIAEQMASAGQVELRMNLPIPPAFICQELLFQMCQLIQEERET